MRGVHSIDIVSSQLSVWAPSQESSEHKTAHKKCNKTEGSDCLKEDANAARWELRSNSAGRVLLK